jgi:hypothetical protein
MLAYGKVRDATLDHAILSGYGGCAEVSADSIPDSLTLTPSGLRTESRLSG